MNFVDFLAVFFPAGKNLLGVEFHIFLSTIDNKVRVFVSVSVDYFCEQLAQSRDYLTRARSMSENNTYSA